MRGEVYWVDLDPRTSLRFYFYQILAVGFHFRSNDCSLVPIRKIFHLIPKNATNIGRLIRPSAVFGPTTAGSESKV